MRGGSASRPGNEYGDVRASVASFVLTINE